jgi:hypothetical protein
MIIELPVRPQGVTDGLQNPAYSPAIQDPVFL